MTGERFSQMPNPRDVTGMIAYRLTQEKHKKDAEDKRLRERQLAEANKQAELEAQWNTKRVAEMSSYVGDNEVIIDMTSGYTIALYGWQERELTAMGVGPTQIKEMIMSSNWPPNGWELPDYED
jgi:hypothetical protein